MLYDLTASFKISFKRLSNIFIQQNASHLQIIDRLAIHVVYHSLTYAHESRQACGAATKDRNSCLAQNRQQWQSMLCMANTMLDENV